MLDLVRFVGDADLTALFASFYEYMDLRVYVNLMLAVQIGGFAPIKVQFHL